MQLQRDGSPPPGLRLPQAKLSRRSNHVSRPRIRRFESYGVPGFDVVSWYGFFVPAKTPTEIITKMIADTIAALADPSVHGRLAPLGYESRPDTPESVGAFLRRKWESGVASLSKPASVRRNDLCLDLACPGLPY